MIAVTQTLSTWGGTFYVSEGLGFLYNNHLRSAAADRARPIPAAHAVVVDERADAAVPGSRAEPRRRPGMPRLAVAAAGNAWIPASVYDIILNVVDGGMPAQAAIEAPRFLIGRDPAEPAVSADPDRRSHPAGHPRRT